MILRNGFLLRSMSFFYTIKRLNDSYFYKRKKMVKVYMFIFNAMIVFFSILNSTTNCGK
jgi:hypothetical protein